MNTEWYENVNEQELNCRFVELREDTLFKKLDIESVIIYQLMWGMCRDGYDKSAMLNYWKNKFCKNQGSKWDQRYQQDLIRKSKKKANEIIEATPSWKSIAY